MSFSCSDPQVILARVKVNICGRVQVDRQRKASTCLGRAQAFVSGLFKGAMSHTIFFFGGMLKWMIKRLKFWTEDLSSLCMTDIPVNQWLNSIY